MNQEQNERVVTNFTEKIADNKILSATMQLIESHPKQKIVLVSKDINLRMKARSIGIEAEDYYSDKVENTDMYSEFQKDRFTADPRVIDSMYSEIGRAHV